MFYNAGSAETVLKSDEEQESGKDLAVFCQKQKRDLRVSGTLLHGLCHEKARTAAD